MQKPVWMTDLSLAVRESYDNNVYLNDVDQSLVPVGTTTLKDRASFINTVSPKIGVNLAKVLDPDHNLQIFSLVYAPDFVTYHAIPEESYNAHRFNSTIAGRDGAFSYNLDNALAFVDGSTVGPSFPGNLFNSFATVSVRDHRKNLQDRAKIALQYDWEKYFVRGVGSLLDYDMMVELKDPALASTPSGYQNYPSRYDLNGGVDFGYKFCPNVAGFLGYRYGHQYQKKLSFASTTNPATHAPYTSDNDYHRLLAGVEGKIGKWLTFQGMGGPDFREYDSAAPVADFHPVKYYGEATVTFTPTATDAVNFKYKQFQFLSCLGVKPYWDSAYELTYSRKISNHLSVDLGGRHASYDFTATTLANGRRIDLDFSLTAGLHYAYNANLGVDLGYLAEFGRNGEDNVVNSQTRNFDRQVVSLGVQFRF